MELEVVFFSFKRENNFNILIRGAGKCSFLCGDRSGSAADTAI